MPYADPDVRREKHRQYRKAWNARNPEKVQTYKERYRSIYGSKGSADMALKRGEQERPDKYWCRFCGYVGPDMHIDHKVPKSKGGSNRLENLQWLCAACNQAKGSLTITEFFDHIEKIINFRATRIFDLDV